MEEPPQWAGRQDYKGSGSLNHSRLTPKAQQTWGGLTVTSAEMQSRSKSRGWRDGSAIKSTGCSSKDVGSIPNTHMVTHNYL